MTPENRTIPDWAQRERQADLDWINNNLDIFWTAASVCREDVGRGAIVIDVTTQPPPGLGNLFTYFSEQEVHGYGNDDTQRMLVQYDPSWEMVLVLLKPDRRTSTYRVGLPALRPEPLEAQPVTPAREQDRTLSPSRPTPPRIETLMEWEAEGGCEAACPEHCWVEPDGTCEHGHPSWLLKMGLI